jgi:hypothetical protein
MSTFSVLQDKNILKERNIMEVPHQVFCLIFKKIGSFLHTLTMAVYTHL